MDALQDQRTAVRPLRDGRAGPRLVWRLRHAGEPQSCRGDGLYLAFALLFWFLQANPQWSLLYDVGAMQNGSRRCRLDHMQLQRTATMAVYSGAPHGESDTTDYRLYMEKEGAPLHAKHYMQIAST